MRNTDELPLDAIDKFYMQIGANVKKYLVKNSYSQLELALALSHKSVGLVSQAELYLKKQHFNLLGNNSPSPMGRNLMLLK